MKFEHFKQDFKTQKIIVSEQDGNTHIYITDKKDIFATPINIEQVIFKTNPWHYSNNILECKGYSPNILMSNDIIYQKWSLSAKIFTDLTKYSSIILFNIEDFEEPEFAIRFLNWMDQYFSDTRLSYYNLYTTLNELLTSFTDEFFPFLEIPLELKYQKDSDEYNEKKEYIKKEIDEFISYFSEYNHFRKSIYQFKDCKIIGIKNLNLFSQLIDSQYQIFKKKERWNIRNYRSTINYEKKIWRLGLHLDLKNFFDSLNPMLKILFPGPKGNLEIDIIFQKGDVFEVIECKSDLAIKFSTQEKYYRKLLNKISPLKEYLKDKGFNIQQINLSIVCDICVAQPPSEIEIYLSEIHFFENFSRKYGLYKWKGSTFFEKYPIIARLGWESLIHGIELKMNLKDLITDSPLWLINGEIENNTIKFKNKIDKEIVITDIELNLDNKINWNELPILLIWNNVNNCIEDFLILPPYWQQSHNDNGFYGKSMSFHNSKNGQKYLNVAVKNGVFGFCEDCKAFPLIPSGQAYKPMQYSAKGTCPNCDNSYDIDQYDLTSFSDNNELLKDIRESFYLRFEV